MGKIRELESTFVMFYYEFMIMQSIFLFGYGFKKVN